MNEDPEVKEEIEAKQEELGTCLERCNVLRGELAELKRPHCPQGGKCDFDTFSGAKGNHYSIQYKCKKCDKIKYVSRGGGRRRITATRRKRRAKKSRRKGGLNFATAMGCKEGQVLASGSRCGFFRGLNPRYMMTGQCCNNQGGGKKKKRRGGTRKKRRKFKKGTKSKTHKGKDFETRKTSKYYNSKRMKRRTGRRRRLAPIFPWA